MDRIENYRQILEKTAKRHARFQPANGEIETRAVCDRASGEYLVIDSGWNEKGRRIYDVVLHFRLQNGTVHVERDNTDAEVVRELLDAGINKDDIVLAYNAPPYQRLNDLIAA
ncbi:MAG TPA: element excision factor XisI family protein [Pyrinomonadaceae bacterium]|jgi:hypothetical protein